MHKIDILMSYSSQDYLNSFRTYDLQKYNENLAYVYFFEPMTWQLLYFSWFTILWLIERSVDGQNEKLNWSQLKFFLCQLKSDLAKVSKF